MSNVNLTIGGRNFAVACASGEESHVMRLGQLIDSKVSSMGEMSSQSEGRMLLFAALLLADELHDAQNAVPGRGDAPQASANFAEKLADIANRLENLAVRLES